MKIGKRSTKGLVKNATKVESDGYVFDSKIEYFFYKRCKDLKIKCVVKPEKFTVLPSFRFNGEAIRPITYTPDFLLPEHNTIIEVKGFANDAFPLRLKLFKHSLVQQGRTEKYVQLKNQKEVDSYLLTLLK